jgi:hypothetical protein
MRTAVLTRQPSTSEGTFGKWTMDTGEVWDSLELPWKDNANGTSCIPVGTYACKWINSPKHGMCYQVMNVPQRSMIEIHSANFAGDKTRGLKCELLGCIGLGKSVGQLTGQQALLGSKVAISEFHAVTGGIDFELTVENAA